jgi:FKBP-type peptidyl-prolyl cis-trans isomerase
MKRIVLVSALAIGLAACGGEDQQAADDTSADDGMAAAEDQMTDMADAVEGAMDDAMDTMEDAGPTYEEQQAAFLAEYAQGEGTMVTNSGLMYRVEREGEGASPDANDIVEVHYEGRLSDGTVFDSSYDRGETIEFPLNRVIPGWTEGLQLMQEGAKYQFAIPAELAYGDRRMGDDIPANSALVFDVELFNVTPVE